MSETTINQRLIFLMDALKMKAGPFSRALGLSETTIRNYVDRSSKPSSDVLEKIFHTFSHVNLVWLVTGEGEPFLPGMALDEPLTSHMKNNYGNNVGNNKGTVSQQYGTPSGADERDTKLALALQEIDSLRAQLANKDALIAAKDETIDLLKSAYSRPN